MTRPFRFFLLPLAMVLVADPVAAQSTSVPQEATDAVGDYLAGRDACLDQYRFGSVLATFTEDESARTVAAGETVTLTGTLQNTNAYPLPGGRLQARILRHDDTVAPQHWHPVVAEFDIPGDFSLAPQESKPFTLTWTAPTGAPEGIYRAEVVYLAAQRFSMSGLSFIPNFTAASQLFFITNPATSTFIDFNRTSVRLNGQPYALRSVPPTFAAGEPLTVTVELDAKHTGPLPLTVTAALHEWAESDADASVVESTQALTLTPGQPLTIPFTWESPVAGAYELKLTAITTDVAVVPSLIKVRFPIAGNRPRLIFAGFTNQEGEHAVVTTCAVNGTFGEGGGRIATAVNASGSVVGTAEQPYDSQGLTTVKTSVPLGQLAQGATISVQAFNDQGELTDSHEIVYDASDISAFTTAQQAADEAAGTPPLGRPARWIVWLVLAALILAGGGLVWTRWSGRSGSAPPVAAAPAVATPPREIPAAAAKPVPVGPPARRPAPPLKPPQPPAPSAPPASDTLPPPQ